MTDEKEGARILSTEEGMDLFNNSILLRGLGPTKDQALVDARNQANERVDFEQFVYLGKMGPEIRTIEQGDTIEFIVYVTYVNREWKARR